MLHQNGDSIVQWLDGLPVHLKKTCDLSFLGVWGKVFCVMDKQDSGNLCLGIERNNRRYFIKYAGATTINYRGEPEHAVLRLRMAAKKYRDLAHPALLPLLETIAPDDGFALVFPWTDAICMGKQYPHRERFLALPLPDKLTIYRQIMSFHLHTLDSGYVPVDFYDGSVLFDEHARQGYICDIDDYQRQPCHNMVGRMPGSTRFMAPEEYQQGAAIDQRTTVYNMGAFAFELFAPNRPRNISHWPDPMKTAWHVAFRATQNQREARYQTLHEMWMAWQNAIGSNT